MKPGTPSAVPWPLFWLLIACALAALGGTLIRDTGPVSASGAKLVPRGTYFSAECDVTNRAAYRLSREVEFTIDASGNTCGAMNALDQRRISVSLGPGETRRVSCDFPNHYRSLPDRVNVAVLILPGASKQVPMELPEGFLAHHSGVALGLKSFCLAVSTLLIARMWRVHRQEAFATKAGWTIILLVPLAGWLAYGGLFHPPGYNETPCPVSSGYT